MSQLAGRARRSRVEGAWKCRRSSSLIGPPDLGTQGFPRAQPRVIPTRRPSCLIPNVSVIAADVLNQTLTKHSIAKEGEGRHPRLRSLPTQVGKNGGDMTPHEFSELTAKYADPFTVMLTITTTSNPVAADVFTNATGSFVYTGQRELLVTNHHVYDAFRTYRRDNPHTKLAMSGADGSLFMDISEAKVLGLDRDLDLAVLHVPHQHVLRQGKMWWVPESWPPLRPKVGRLAALYGYPGEGRTLEGDVLGASPLSVGLPVVSVSQRHFVLVDEDQDAHVLVPDGQTPLTHFGGISGSAVYVMPNHFSAAGDTIGLCGFVYEQSQSGAIYVVHADYINANGSIR